MTSRFGIHKRLKERHSVAYVGCSVAPSFCRLCSLHLRCASITILCFVCVNLSSILYVAHCVLKHLRQYTPAHCDNVTTDTRLAVMVIAAGALLTAMTLVTIMNFKLAAVMLIRIETIMMLRVIAAPCCC